MPRVWGSLGWDGGGVGSWGYSNKKTKSVGRIRRGRENEVRKGRGRRGEEGRRGEKEKGRRERKGK